ncbi:hypothetical protein D3C80_1616040 [compost metagenome]
MRPAKHFVENTSPKLSRIDPVSGLKFLPKNLNHVGGFAERIEQNRAAGGFIETGQTVKHRGFSSAIRPD